jgi:hypothetical protein
MLCVGGRLNVTLGSGPETTFTDHPRNDPSKLRLAATMPREMENRDMSNAARDTFVVGLRNAHAMEVQARELMERQSERLDEYPEVKAKVVAHLQETNEQLNPA